MSIPLVNFWEMPPFAPMQPSLPARSWWAEIQSAKCRRVSASCSGYAGPFWLWNFKLPSCEAKDKHVSSQHLRIYRDERLRFYVEDRRARSNPTLIVLKRIVDDLLAGSVVLLALAICPTLAAACCEELASSGCFINNQFVRRLGSTDQFACSSRRSRDLTCSFYPEVVWIGVPVMVLPGGQRTLCPTSPMPSPSRSSGIV